MRKLILLTLCLSLLSLSLYAESNIVPMEKLREIAHRNAESLWGDVHPAEAIPYYSVDDEIVAYAFNYAIDKGFPDKQSLIDECESKATDMNKYARWGVDEYAHLIMSNRYDRIVTIRHIKALSDEFAYGAQIRQMAVDYLNTNAVNLDKIYYLSPMLKYYKYVGNGNVVYVRIFPPMQTLSQSEFQKEVAENYNLDEIIPKGSRSSWDTYLSGTPLRDGTRAPVYIPYQDECVPFLDWSFGCSPTAGAMLLDYWDNYSYYSASDYGNLTQYHYQRWDCCQGETDYNVTNAQYWCAIYMNTDSLTGSTSSGDIGPGLVDAANSSHLGSYSFSQTTTFYSTGSDPTKWAEQVDEIDNGRPWHCGKPGHSMTAIGYEISAGDSFMIVHNTWHPPNDWWNYTENYRLTEVFPGGQYGCAVILEKPDGDPRYSDYVTPPSQGEDLYAGDVYEITWDKDYLYGSYVKLYYSTTGGHGTWYTITSNTPNDGVYDWVIPSGLSSTQGRIKVEIWDGSGKAAADGSWGNFTFHSGGSLEVLGSDSKVNTTTDPDYYQFNQSYSTWCAVGVRCNTAGENWSMKMYTDNTFTTELVSSAYSYPVDFVVMDRHHSPSGYRGIKAYRYSGSDNASVEFEGYNETITPGVTYSTSWPAGDVVEMYDVHLSPGTYSFDLTFTSGTADLDIALFGSSGSAYYGNRQDYLARSINSGGGVNESFTYTVTTDDYYGFCVWSNDGNSASYDIDIDPMIAGLWTGAVNYNWNNPPNWDDGNVPDATTDVVIPSSYTYRPIVYITDAYCNNITVESGAILEVQDENLNVSGNMTVHGEFRMTDNAGNLYVDGDIIWESGSSASITAGSAEMYISGNWNFESGANVQLDNGYVEFEGNSNKYIRSYESNCYFNHVRSDKNSAYIGVSSWSTDTLHINGNLYNYSGSSFNGYSDYPIVLGGFFNNMGGHFLFDYGTFVFEGPVAGHPLKPNTGDYFNNLKIDTGAHSLALDASYSTTLQINGDFVLESGYFSPGSFRVEVGGDWTNNAGVGHFHESTSRVVFNGSSHQYVNSDETFNILEVDCGAALRVNDASHTVTCSTYDWTSGGIDVLAGTFTALDLEDNGIYGGYWLNPNGTINLYQDGSQYIDLNGTLWISGGTMNVYGGSITSYWPYSADASIEMSGGTLDFHDKGIYLYDSATYTLTENITGGTIRTAYSFTGNRTDFTPTGGTIELYGTTDANMNMGTGSNFYDVEINKSTKAKSGSSRIKEKGYVIVEERDGTITRYERANTVNVDSDLDINGNLLIDNGTFNLNGHTVDVAHDVDVYGTLNMTNATDVLNVGTDNWDNLTFYSGSTGNISNGEIYLKSWIVPKAGSSFTASTSNTIYFIGSNTSGGLANNEPSTVYGNIDLNKSANRIYLDDLATEPIIVNGNFVIHADNILEMRNNTLEVHGNFTDNATSSVYVYAATKVGNNAASSGKIRSSKDSGTKGGYLEIDTDFTLNGLLDVGDGDVLVHGTFELATTGTLTIDGGSFISDAPYSKDRTWQYLRGTFNLSDGLFEITHNSIYFASTCIDTITGGIIRTGHSFHAMDPNVFQPTGGDVEFTGTGGGPFIRCDYSDNNYFHNFIFNSAVEILLYSDITVQNDVEINSGILNTYGYDMYVGGDWTNNVGDAGFVEGTETVIFNGSNYTDITTDETFYNLTIDKILGTWYGTEIMDGVTVNVTEDLNINDGTLEMNDGSSLNIGNDLDIATDAGLNAYLDIGLNISVGGNWTNNNTRNDSWVGFYYGTSTVTFNGNTDQVVTSSCSADSFYNVVVDKPAGNFRPSNNTEVFGNLTISDGDWWDYSSSLTHSVYGDFTVAAGAGWLGTTSNTIVFKGTDDQNLSFDPSSTNGYFRNVLIDKTAKAVKNSTPTGEELLVKAKEKDGSKTQTVTLLSDCISLGNGYLTVDQGTLNLNGNYYRCTGNVTINNGGKIAIDDNAWLEVGGGYALNVNTGGTLELIGSAGNLAKLTHHSGYYDVEIESGGTISAEYAIFEYITANGIQVKNGAIIDNNHTFNNCIFRNGIAGGTLLTINNNQTLTVNNADFPTNTWGGNWNVSKTINQGNVEFFDATGDFAGEAYDNDPFNRIDWTTSGQPDLTITNVVWSDMNPYVCDTISVEITVKNIGTADVTDWFYVDLYYNLPTPPGIGEFGDDAEYIDSGLPVGDSLIVNFDVTYDIAETWSSYVQVDADSNITELDEGNNVWGPDAITWNALPAITDLVIQYNTGTGEIELNWTYPIWVSRYNIYRDTDPYFTPVTPYDDTGVTSWSEPASGTKYFYIVTAERDLPAPSVKMSGSGNNRRIGKR